jgi:hypothetical protein
MHVLNIQQNIVQLDHGIYQLLVKCFMYYHESILSNKHFICLMKLYQDARIQSITMHVIGHLHITHQTVFGT